MTINIYRSDDASAPSLTGQVGSLTTVLDAILVNGYGAKSSAGWAIAYTATNQRAYRAALGNRFFLAIDDTNPAPYSGGANFGRISSYETMSSAVLGTGQIPTKAQVTAMTLTGIGALVMKSASADSTARPWIAYVSDTFIHFYVHQANTMTQGFYTLGVGNVTGFLYGDLVQPQKAGDAYHTLLVASQSISAYSFQGGNLLGNTTGALPGHFLQRAFTQINAGIVCGKGGIGRGMGNGTAFCLEPGAVNFPDPITGAYEQAEVWVYENVSGLYGTRGKVPGIFNPQHAQTSIIAQFQMFDTIPGSGTFAGLTFQFMQPGSSCVATMQINGTW